MQLTVNTRFNWRRGRESNPRIKVLQTFFQRSSTPIHSTKSHSGTGVFAGFLPGAASVLLLAAPLFAADDLRSVTVTDQAIPAVALIPARTSTDLWIHQAPARKSREHPKLRRLSIAASCVASAMDYASTMKAMRVPGVVEGNPLLRGADGKASPGKLISLKAGICAAQFLAGETHFIGRFLKDETDTGGMTQREKSDEIMLANGAETAALFGYIAWQNGRVADSVARRNAVAAANAAVWGKR